MPKNSFLLGLVLITCSCASVKKNTSRTETTGLYTDNSTVQKERAKVTIITETAGAPVAIRPDTAGFTGYMAINDSSGFHQKVTAGAVTLDATIKPRRDNLGKTTGYDISASATKGPETITAPVNRQITTTETGKEVQQAAVKDVTTEKSATADKTAFRFNVTGAIAVICCILGLAALCLIYRYFKPVKNERD